MTPALRELKCHCGHLGDRGGHLGAGKLTPVDGFGLYTDQGAMFRNLNGGSPALVRNPG